ncbi:MAG: hypothetical protein ACD_62C00375G0001, partial [uncultured bacterium]
TLRQAQGRLRDEDTRGNGLWVMGDSFSSPITHYNKCLMLQAYFVKPEYVFALQNPMTRLG